MTFILFVGGLLALLFGGDWLVNGASGVAERFKVPPLVIGLTIVGFGTSMPELLVSLDAASSGRSGISIGNVVGSNIANILLILGTSAMIGPLAAPFMRLRRDLAWMLAAAVICVPIFWNGSVGPVEGTFLVIGISAYILMNVLASGSEEPEPGSVPPSLGRAVFMALGGLVTLLVGARLLVDSATEIARSFGVSEAVIGLTIVAVGTSLPELATSVVAAWRGQREIALGNVIGSNIFNVLAILGITSLLHKIPVEPRFLAFDVPVMIAASLLLIVLMWAREGVGRVGGAAFITVYTAYVASTAF